MKVTILETKIPELQGPKRSEGVHLSEVVSDIAVQLGIFHKDREEQLPLDKFALGFAWELYLERTWCRDHGVIRPKEVTLDGITGSPDGVGYDDSNKMFLAEYKHTWYSSNKSFDDMWYWQSQTKSYCWMLTCQEGELVDTVRMPIYFVNGDYVYPLSPVFREYLIEYTLDDLVHNWRMVTTHAISKKWIRPEQAVSLKQ